MSHKYRLQQKVRLARLGYSDGLARDGDLYEITRLMPADRSGEYSYRIKTAGGGERAVREVEIVPLNAEADARQAVFR